MDNPLGKIHRLHYLVIGYSIMLFIIASVFLFFYFLATRHAPPFLLTAVVYNTIWVIGTYSMVKYSYMQGLHDSIQADPRLQERMQ
ncbi:hypothetical protein [Alteromonas flava]|uniref:hypothetical protein n=1 Tax=Alteromonas flava TaxID=2048003 RepID=UPI000C28B76A|nr:hypothetical protein [Alteromonas flava]